MGEESLRRVVLDTNVLVSALLFTGPSNQLVHLWQKGSLEFLASAAIVREYSRVLAYHKFRLTKEEITALLHEEILPFITPVKTTKVPAVIKEAPSDDQFLACAVAGKADALVSGDKHLLKLGSYERIPIITVRNCLERLGMGN